MQRGGEDKESRLSKVVQNPSSCHKADCTQQCADNLV